MRHWFQSQGRSLTRVTAQFFLPFLVSAFCAPMSAAPKAMHIRLPQTLSDSVVVDREDSTALTQEDAHNLLQVTVDDASAPEQTRSPIQGRYEILPGQIRFTPFFPFVPGQRYRVELRQLDLEKLPPEVATFRISNGAMPPPPRVLAIAPSARTLPSNTLRFYILFSRSMRGQFDRRSVHLIDDTGCDVSGAFMSFGQELWSSDGKRLTLLFDPGRIKRGVTANLIQGPPLITGRTYRLLAAPNATVTFQVALPLRTPLNPKQWYLTRPRAGTRSPLVIQFDRVMDAALIQDSIEIRSDDNVYVKGRIQSAKGERECLFTPEKPWKPTQYTIIFSPDLEDVSGNRIGEALDHELGSARQRTVFNRTTRLNFSPKR